MLQALEIRAPFAATHMKQLGGWWEFGNLTGGSCEAQTLNTHFWKCKI